MSGPVRSRIPQFVTAGLLITGPARGRRFTTPGHTHPLEFRAPSVGYCTHGKGGHSQPELQSQAAKPRLPANKGL